MSEAKITKCLTCGGDLAPNSKGIPTCQFCGREYNEAVGGFSNELQEIVKRRQLREFIQAEELCNELLKKQPENSEAYWQMLLSALGVVYVQEDNKAKPTFFSYSYDNRDVIKNNAYFKKALEYATSEEERQYYNEHAQELDELLKEFFNLVAKEASYDVFISFKRTTEATVNGEVRYIETDDCRKAEEIYKHFSKKYKVFFSPVSIGKDTGIVGEKYEPRILKALQTSQVMILLGSRKEYLEAQWVQNEWRRYQYFINKGKKNKASMILGYEKMMPSLPSALKDIQLDSFDWYSGGYLKELEKKLEPLVKTNKGFMSKLTQKKNTSEHFESDEGEFNSGYNADRITFNAKGKNIEIKIPANEKRDMQLADSSRGQGRFKDAIKKYTEILKNNPENAMAYWLRFCCKLEVKNETDVPQAIINAKKEYYADIDSAVQKTSDEKFYWSVIDKLIISFGITAISWKQLEILSDCLFKYIDESRSTRLLNQLEIQYKYYIDKGNVKTAEEVFAAARKLFFDANLNFNIRYMKNYAICLYEHSEYDRARKYFEELAGARKDSEVYLYLLKCRVKTQHIETTKFKLKIDATDDPSAKKPSELDLDEIIERIILCRPNAKIQNTLEAIVMYQIGFNRRKAGDFIVTIASCIKNSKEESKKCSACGEELVETEKGGVLKCPNCEKEFVSTDYGLISFLSAVANRYIQVKDFKNAKVYYNEMLNVNPNYSKAHWGLLKCRLKAFDDYDLIKNRKSLQNYEEFNNAINCSTNDECEQYMAIYNAQGEKHNTKDRERTNKKVWLAMTKGKRAFKKMVTALCIIAVCVFGVYSYFGISSPVYYSNNESGSLVINGKSIYFNMLTKDLEISDYNGSAITGINKNSFKNSSLNTVTLGSTVTAVGDSAFENSKKLTEFNAVAANITIGDYAFKNCVNLESFNLGYVKGRASLSASSLTNTSIGEGAFENCTSLKSLKIDNCSAIGKNAFYGCENLTSLTLDISSTKNIADGAFDGMNKNVKIRIPTVEETVFNNLKSKFSGVTFETYTRDSVEECMYFINKISTVTLASKDNIEKAEALYNALNSSDKSKITNLSKLTDARAVYETMVLINAIGTVTAASESKIAAAEKAYNLLTDSQKASVTNYNTLTSARTNIKPLLVIEQINSIGTVTLSKEAQIVKVEAAYSELTSAQMKIVTNYNTLVTARTTLNGLLVDDAIAKIKAIGTITLDSSSALKTAESAYNKLTDTLKSKVTNRQVLADGLAVYDVMKKIDDIGTVSISSLSDITTAEEAYASLSLALKSQVSNFGVIAEKRKIYTLAVALDSLGTVYLGNGSDEKYRTVTAESMSALNDSSVCEKITSITVTGLTQIDTASWSSVLTNLDTIIYDQSSKTSSPETFKLDSAFANKIIGSADRSTSTSLTATAGETLNLVLENFRFRTLSISNVETADVTFAGVCSISGSAAGTAIVANNLTLTMQSGATVSIKGGSSSDGISAKTLKITDIPSTESPASMTVTGGQGYSPVDSGNDVGNGIIMTMSGVSGGIGGNGITANSVTVDLSGSLTVTGGVGGNGNKGQDATANGAQGGVGGTGGTGGIGISTDKLTVLSGILEIIGGNGGNGGTGGNGGKGSAGADGVKGNQTSGNGKAGSDGGAGGVGGTGGTGGVALKCTQCDIDVTITLKGGNGGTAGRGGTGGDGGKGGDGAIENNVGIWTNYTWNGGNGGNGGKGGDAGTKGTGGAAYSGAYSENMDIKAGEIGIGNYGGGGGAGGAGGAAGKRSAWNGTNTGKVGVTGVSGSTGKNTN